VWQRAWDERNRSFLMFGVAEDAQGPERVQQLQREHRVEFPVLVDRESAVARELGFEVVPSGFFLEDGVVRYAHVDDFDIGDPRVRRNLVDFLAGARVRNPRQHRRINRSALELFAEGVEAYSRGDVETALHRWRQALEFDADNFLIRSQIWAVEHPEHFYPSVDREWQQLQLIKEGYAKPLP
jgi:hypothetical protein